MTAEQNARVIEAVFAELRTHLPAGSGIKVSPRTKWTIVQRADEGSEAIPGTGMIMSVTARSADGRPLAASGSDEAVRNLAPRWPIIPLRLRRRMAAEHALGMLLRLFYPGDQSNGFHRGPDCRIKSADRVDGICLMYRPPDSASSVELPPIPWETFGQMRT